MKLPKKIAALLTVTLVTSSAGNLGYADTLQRIADSKLVGAGRWETAIEVSKNGWTSSTEAVIVNDSAIADALAATPFAEAKNAPILLTGKDKLDERTSAELKRLGVKKVYLIGGKDVLSKSIESDLKSKNIESDRIEGATRELTALEIAKRLNDIKKVTQIAVVNGTTGLADAVSIAATAAKKDMAIILSNPTEGTKASDEFIKSNGIENSYVIGGPKAISKEVESKLPNAVRIEGIDRNETNAKVLEYFYTEKEIKNAYVAKDGMAKPDQLIDALAVGVLAAKNNSPVIIVGNKLNEMQKDITNTKSFKTVTQVGGRGNETAFNELKNMQGVTTYEVNTVAELNDALAKADANDVINVNSLSENSRKNVKGLNENSRNGKVEITSKYAVEVNLINANDKYVVLNVGSGTVKVHGKHLNVDIESGKVVISGVIENINVLEGGAVSISNEGNSKPNVTVAEGASVNVAGTINTITLSGGDASVSIEKGSTVSKVEVSKEATGAVVENAGKVDNITVNAKDTSVSVSKDAIVGKVEVGKDGSGAVIENAGKVDKVTSNAPNVKVENNGTVGTVSGTGSNKPTVDNSGGGVVTQPSTPSTPSIPSTPSTPSIPSKPNVSVTSVSIQPVDATLDKDGKVIIEVGGSAQLTARVYPDDATNKNVTWSSDNKEVATISNEGMINAITTGSTIITVTTVDGEETDTCEVEVVPNKAKLMKKDNILKFEELKNWKDKLDSLKAGIYNEDVNRLIDNHISSILNEGTEESTVKSSIHIDNNNNKIIIIGETTTEMILDNNEDEYNTYEDEKRINDILTHAVIKLNNSHDSFNGDLISEVLDISLLEHTIKDIPIPAGLNKENTIQALADSLTLKDYQVNMKSRSNTLEIPSDKLDLENLEILLQESTPKNARNKSNIKDLIYLIQKMPTFILNIKWNTDNFSSELPNTKTAKDDNSDNESNTVDVNIGISLNLQDLLNSIIVENSDDNQNDDNVDSQDDSKNEHKEDEKMVNIIDSILAKDDINLSTIKAVIDYTGAEKSKHELTLNSKVIFDFDVKDIALNEDVTLPTLYLVEGVSDDEINKKLNEIKDEYKKKIIGGSIPLFINVNTDDVRYDSSSDEIYGIVEIKFNDIVVGKHKVTVPIEYISITDHIESILVEIKESITSTLTEEQIKCIKEQIAQIRELYGKLTEDEIESIEVVLSDVEAEIKAFEDISNSNKGETLTQAEKYRKESIEKFEELQAWKEEMDLLLEDENLPSDIRKDITSKITLIDSTIEEVVKNLDIAEDTKNLILKYLENDIKQMKAVDLDTGKVKVVNYNLVLGWPFIKLSVKEHDLDKDSVKDEEEEKSILTYIKIVSSIVNPAIDGIENSLKASIESMIKDLTTISIGGYTINDIPIPAGMKKENTIDVLTTLLTVEGFKINKNSRTGELEIPADKLDIEKLQILQDESSDKQTKATIDDLTHLIENVPELTLKVKWDTSKFSSELDEESFIDAKISILLNLEDFINLSTDPVVGNLINSLVAKPDNKIDLSFIKSTADYLGIELSDYNVELMYNIRFEFDVKDSTVTLPELKLPQEIPTPYVEEILNLTSRGYVQKIIGGEIPLEYKVIPTWDAYDSNSKELKGNIIVKLNDKEIMNHNIIVPIKRVSVVEYVEEEINKINGRIDGLVDESMKEDIIGYIGNLKELVDSSTELDINKEILINQLNQLMSQINQKVNN